MVRFGYDGRAFYGWARQPGLRTVEGEILRGLVERGVVPSTESDRLEVASRTDRGVSAVGNALSLSSERSAPVLLRMLNGISPELFFSAAAPAPEQFRIRRAVRRVYRYFEPARGHDLRTWQTAADLFSGTVDARSLGRGLPSGGPVWRTVESVRVTRSGELLLIEVAAPSFVWGMVRKIVAALRAVDEGSLPTARLKSALAGRERLTLPMAEPERLLLWDVELPVPWTVRWEGPNRHQSRWWSSAQDEATARGSVLDAIGQGLALREP